MRHPSIKAQPCGATVFGLPSLFRKCRREVPRLASLARDDHVKQKRKTSSSSRSEITASNELALGNGAVEEFENVQDFVVSAVDGGTGAKLQDATGIGGDDGLGLRLLHGLHFAGEQFE
jgi:hypothetical protein